MPAEERPVEGMRRATAQEIAWAKRIIGKDALDVQHAVQVDEGEGEHAPLFTETSRTPAFEGEAGYVTGWIQAWIYVDIPLAESGEGVAEYTAEEEEEEK